MSRYGWALILLAYVLGLLSTGLSVSPWVCAGVGLALGLGGAIAISPRWRLGPRARIWLLAGVLVGVAIAHFHLRSPQPGAWDISRWVEQTPNSVTVTGEILEMPRQNRQGRIRFPLAVTQLNQNPNIRGKLYVTVPLLHGTGLVIGQTVAITGRLYAPSPAQTPGSFDFREYLANQGIFAGLSGELTGEPTTIPGGFWQVRRRMVRALVDGLGSPDGMLIGSMVLGRRAVDLPSDVQQQFTQVGLAHTLAASGFHVSLLLGSVLMLVKRASSRVQLGVGGVTLAFYLALTGLHPSVVRAALMGLAGLSGLVLRRGTRPMGLLLVTATGLLVINPLWIWDVGFQLSFMATAGLVTTVPALQARFAKIPDAIATPILIPIAVIIWTMPITLVHFHVMPLYGILTNALTAPFITVLTLGGMLSAAIAALVPPLGASVASLLFFPVEVLRGLVAWVVSLPLSQWNGGAIALWQLLLVYGAIALLYWLRPMPWQKWGLGTLIAATLIVPYAVQQLTHVQITVLAARDYPVVVIQDHGTTGVIGVGDRQTFDYQLAPFLAQAGINRLDTVIRLARDSEEASQALLERYRPRHLRQVGAIPAVTSPVMAQPLQPAEALPIGHTRLQLTTANPPLFQLQRQAKTWLIAPDPLTPIPDQAPRPDVVIARDRALIAPLLTTPDPAVAITVESESDVSIPGSYTLATDGAIWWTPQRGIQTEREVSAWED